MRDLAAMYGRATELQQRMSRMRDRYGAAALRAAGACGVRLEHRFAAVTPAEATLYVHGIVGDEWDGLDSGTFARELAALDVKTIQLRINSPGGFVSHGVAMYQALREHPARKVGHVDGMAASMATVIAMAADELHIAKPGRMMIHDAWGIAIGNAGDMLAEAELLDGLSQDIAAVYADRTGKGTPASWRTAMLAETWYSSAQAVAVGLADTVKTETARGGEPEDRATQLIRARARANKII